MYTIYINVPGDKIVSIYVINPKQRLLLHTYRFSVLWMEILNIIYNYLYYRMRNIVHVHILILHNSNNR